MDIYKIFFIDKKQRENKTERKLSVNGACSKASFPIVRGEAMKVERLKGTVAKRNSMGKRELSKRWHYRANSSESKKNLWTFTFDHTTHAHRHTRERERELSIDILHLEKRISIYVFIWNRVKVAGKKLSLLSQHFLYFSLFLYNIKLSVRKCAKKCGLQKASGITTATKSSINTSKSNNTWVVVCVCTWNVERMGMRNALCLH